MKLENIETTGAPHIVFVTSAVGGGPFNSHISSIHDFQVSI